MTAVLAVASVAIAVLHAFARLRSAATHPVTLFPEAAAAAPVDDYARAVCIFLHGAGHPTSEEPTAAFPDYWGQVHEHLASLCAVFSFVREDTLQFGWQDPPLQRKVCTRIHEAVESCSAAGGAPCRAVLFAHSLANLILAGALHAGRCALPPAAAWFSVAAPWQGSRAADRLPEVCRTNATARGGSDAMARADSLMNEQIRALAQREHFCGGVDGGPSVGFASLTTTNAALREVAGWAARVNGSLCGDSSFGLWSFDSWSLRALDRFASFGEPNDGAVAVAGCLPAGAPAERSHDSPHYTAAVNHFDTTCRHGDGSLLWMSGDDRRPCAWYEGRVRSVVMG